jgi:hypothetical protein
VNQVGFVVAGGCIHDDVDAGRERHLALRSRLAPRDRVAGCGRAPARSRDPAIKKRQRPRFWHLARRPKRTRSDRYAANKDEHAASFDHPLRLTGPGYHFSLEARFAASQGPACQAQLGARLWKPKTQPWKRPLY